MQRSTHRLALLLLAERKQIPHGEESMDIRTILVPVDFSAYAEKAVCWALALAERWCPRLLLLHVVPIPSYPPMLMGTYFNPANFEAGLRAEAEARVKEFVTSLGKTTVPVDTQ